MPENLADILRKQRAECLISQAEIIRDFPACQQRMKEAQTYVREAMLQCTLGCITDEEKYGVFPLPSCR